MMKKKNYTYNPYKFFAIVIIGFILLIVFINYKTKSFNTYAILECTVNESVNENYSEKMTYKFNKKEDNKLIGFYRDEVYDFTNDDTNMEKVFDYLVDYRNTIKDGIDSMNFKYDVTKKDKKILVNTYINVNSAYELFNNYLKNADINNESTPKHIYENLTIDNKYTCVETESRK